MMPVCGAAATTRARRGGLLGPGRRWRGGSRAGRYRLCLLGTGTGTGIVGDAIKVMGGLQMESQSAVASKLSNVVVGDTETARRGETRRSSRETRDEREGEGERVN